MQIISIAEEERHEFELELYLPDKLASCSLPKGVWRCCGLNGLIAQHIASDANFKARAGFSRQADCRLAPARAEAACACAHVRMHVRLAPASEGLVAAAKTAILRGLAVAIVAGEASSCVCACMLSTCAAAVRAPSPPYMTAAYAQTPHIGIAMKCRHGKHRSVAFSFLVWSALRSAGCEASLEHRSNLSPLHCAHSARSMMRGVPQRLARTQALWRLRHPCGCPSNC